MGREAELYKAAQGNPLEGYFLLKAEGKNMPPAFSERSAQSRRSRHERVSEVLHGGDWGGITTLRDWEQAYLKECFYRRNTYTSGIRTFGNKRPVKALSQPFTALPGQSHLKDWDLCACQQQD